MAFNSNTNAYVFFYNSNPLYIILIAIAIQTTLIPFCVKLNQTYKTKKDLKTI